MQRIHTVGRGSLLALMRSARGDQGARTESSGLIYLPRPLDPHKPVTSSPIEAPGTSAGPERVEELESAGAE